jgi:phage terminase large subunit GpA-like protein
VASAIDSGYATGEVYAFARKYRDARAVVIKGDSRVPAPISQLSPIDVGPRGASVKFGIRIWPVNGSMIKEELYRWLRLDRPTEESGEPYPPGYCHFPQYGEEYFKQITAEQLVTRVVKGYRRTEWQKIRDRNEALDVRLYSRSAAAVYGMDRFNDAVWKTLEDRVEEMSKRVGQPAVPQQPIGPSQRTIRGRFFTNDAPPRRW